MHSRTDLVQG